MKTLFVALAVCALTVSGCATEPLALATPSGRPEAIFSGQPPPVVASKLSNMCLDRRHVLIDVTPTQVVCQIDLGALTSALLTPVMGNSSSTSPAMFVRFTMIQNGPDTRVQAYEWIETTMSFGQRRTIEIRSNDQRNLIQAALTDAAGR